MNKTKKTALIVMNMQNIYTDPKGRLYYPMIDEVMPKIIDGINRLREAGVLIVFANSIAAGNETTLDTAVAARKDPVPLLGSWEAQMDPRIKVEKDDLIVHHYADSAFFHTELGMMLRARDIENGITCGVKMNYAVRATAGDVQWYKFQSYVASEMVACDSVERTKQHLEELTKYMSKDLPTDEILARIERGAL